MRITELLTKKTMILDLESSSKDQVINELSEKLDSAGHLQDLQAFKKAIHARENESTTGIGEGIAIPHAKTAAVKAPAIVFGRSEVGIDYQSLDGQPAHLFFMIAATEGANQTHLEALSRLSSFLMDTEFRKGLLKARSEEEVLQAFDQKEEENEETEEEESNQASGKILAVTACPTGIAHTYMAADALKAKAAELGYGVKVETNGSGGVKNRLTDEEIQRAPAIIVAADTKVEMDRFKSKKVIEVPVAEAIRKPAELLKRASSGEAPIYNATGSYEDQISEKKSERKGKQSPFYKHLMNGVSNMLPLVVGGGILIALSFIFGINAADPDDPSYNAFAAALSTIGGGNAFALMIPVLAGFIAMSIADRPGLAPGLVGGLMASTNGAGFLGGLIAGFLAGYAVLLLKKLFSNLPQSLEGLKPVLLYPLFGIFITGIIMMYVVIEPVGALNTGLENWLSGMGTTNKLLLGLILGGMMAVDMGGPINKAAFTFGIAMIDAGNLTYHAAIMAGGMTPPLGLALATTLFKKRFNQTEKEAGKVAYVMGASFITEGAIPFAAADPGRVIPSIIVGSSLAGALTMLFNIALPAPHGGAFVMWSVNNISLSHILLYILAIVIGTIVTALMVGILKKSKPEVQA
ncbi:PTS fructose transporter subunit IIABC [Guptibacillus hwajinpoensis]|uniref:PTS system fructose-specific IIC component n=1 Tax=Guptibacillus hwajinpoensis TaxID=208199 RepID=A0ABU0JZB4_9BACL|nr:PTS fructose transporter subunit IIABC [Alkalihalobacillus hemicentroti]MDQ0481242.1 PTS system fructose-specific IIC component [Alkalihalobacillus hemicentroti]